jgi:hypothetical protein
MMAAFPDADQLDAAWLNVNAIAVVFVVVVVVVKSIVLIIIVAESRD